MQIGAVTDKIASSIAVFGLSWPWSCLLLALAYFYSHFFFASNLSHVSAMCQAFLSIAVAAGLIQATPHESQRFPCSLL